MKKLTDCITGDKVYFEGGMGNSEEGVEVIQEVDFKFDQNTGDKYKIFRIHEDHWFDSRTGMVFSGPTMYSIDVLQD